jgi:phage shock protein PspC (stress-responsive transcriptional regulator)
MENQANQSTIRFACPRCRTTLNAKASLAGKRLKCPKCSQVISVPSGQEIAGAPTSRISEANRPSELSSDERVKELADVCDRTRSKFSMVLYRGRIKIGSELNPKWETRCRSNLKIPSDETIVAFVDAGRVFASGYYGLAVTENGIYWQSSGNGSLLSIFKAIRYSKRSMTWAELDGLPLRMETGVFSLSRYDIVFGNDDARYEATGRTSNAHVYELLLALQQWVSDKGDALRRLPDNSKSHRVWFYASQDGRKTGPVDFATTKKLAANGAIKPSTLMWEEGIADGVPAASVRGLFGASDGTGFDAAEVTSMPPVDDTGASPDPRYLNFYKSSDQVMITGLSAGVAHRLGKPLLLVRAATLLGFGTGIFVLIYYAASLMLPALPTKRVPSPSHHINDLVRRRRR